MIIRAEQEDEKVASAYSAHVLGGEQFYLSFASYGGNTPSEILGHIANTCKHTSSPSASFSGSSCNVWAIAGYIQTPSIFLSLLCAINGVEPRLRGFIVRINMHLYSPRNCHTLLFLLMYEHSIKAHSIKEDNPHWRFSAVFEK